MEIAALVNLALLAGFNCAWGGVQKSAYKTQWRFFTKIFFLLQAPLYNIMISVISNETAQLSTLSGLNN